MFIWESIKRFVGLHGALVLVALGIIAAGTWGFIELTDEVVEGETGAFDERVIGWMAGHEGPRWLQIMGRDVTALGGVAVLVGMTVAVAGYFALRRKFHVVVLLFVATVGGTLLNTGLKQIIGRERPPAEGRMVNEISHSFPSGHAMMSATVYLTLGTILARLSKSWAAQVYFLSLAIVVTVLVGVSRVYLRVHWPTDVIAGWSAGLVWAALLWLVTHFLQRRGIVERDTETG